MLDLIIIALVAAVVVSRFTKFRLPKDPRNRDARKNDLDRLRGTPPRREEPTNVVDITASAEATPATPKANKAKLERMQREAAKNLTGLAKIKALDTGFDEQSFLEGARQAYGYFYTCWNAKDEDGLAKLCAPALHDRLVMEMADDSWQPVHVDEIYDARLLNARVHGKTAVIEVQFDTQEREGSMPARALQRRWVLARPLGSDDPNWELEDMHTGADA